MPDITFKANLLPALQLAFAGQRAVNGTAAVTGILSLTPPPAPKGRYAFGRQAEKIEREIQGWEKARIALNERHCRRDADGKPVMIDVPGGQKYDLGDNLVAFNTELEQMGEEPITLTGVRMVLHAELGDCPLTVQQERVLITAGLLDDKEPE